ncbi:MAG: hypothetical protein ACHP8A_18585 [Terriglobales bacterium]
MNQDDLFERLVENALDFLHQSIKEFKELPKYSVIHFHAAVELFLKARLVAEHWTLIVSRRQDPEWERVVKGDFISVSLDEAATKLEKVVQSGLTNYELRTFKDVTTHRNKMVHFFHDASLADNNPTVRQAIAKQQLTAWYLLHKLLRNRWSEIFEPWTEQIAALDKELRAYHDFLQAIFDDLTDEIKRLEKVGLIFESCPSCGFNAIGDSHETDVIYEVNCLVCGFIQKRLSVECDECGETVNFVDEGISQCESCEKNYEPNDVVDLLYDRQKAEYASHDGDSSLELGNCSNCDGYHTVIPIEDGERFNCVSCFGEFDSLDVCEWCNEPNSGDMDGSYFSGCSHCGGRGEWDGNGQND